MEKHFLKDYIKDKKLNIDQVINDYSNYVYSVVKNSVSIMITDEDIEEIISDVFFALWKNYTSLNEKLDIKLYLIGISKNTIKNKYRKTQVNIPISDYEEKLVSTYNIEEDIENIEQEKKIYEIIKTLKEVEYKVFILYYFEAKTTKEISVALSISVNNVKVILYRVRKIIKKKLKEGGYSYGK